MHSPFVNERALGRWRIFSWLADLRAARACLALAASFAVIHSVAWSLRDPAAILPRFWLSKGDGNWMEPWKFVSYAFIHGNIWHLAINVLGLLVIGSKVEWISNPGGMLKVFLSGVLLGGAVQLVLAPPAQMGVPLVGASGGIFALLLWLTTVAPELRTRPVRVSGKNLGRGIVIAESGLLALLWLLPEDGILPVAHACHLGGAFAGWGLGRRTYRRLPTLDDLRKERTRRESAGGPLG